MLLEAEPVPVEAKVECEIEMVSQVKAPLVGREVPKIVQPPPKPAKMLSHKSIAKQSTTVSPKKVERVATIQKT